MATVAYLRVSTEEQHLGPEAQRAAIEAWAKARGVSITSWHLDQGVSGAAELTDRPGLLEALDALRGHGAGLLVVANGLIPTATARRIRRMFQQGLLKDKVILVTGGGTGLGKAMSKRFGELGARLVIASRNPEHFEPTAEEFRKGGIDVLSLTCDVRQPESVEHMVAKSVERFSRIDGLVNNAAGNFLCPTESLSYNGFNSVVQIVQYGTFNCTLAVGKQMIEQGTGGSVLSILTTYAWTGSAYVLPSAMAKAAVLVLTRSLAVEWAHYKIRFNAIAPGPFPTEGAWSRLAPPGVGVDAAAKRVPLGRVGNTDELANLASYLMSDGAGYITGDCVTVDGGEWLGGAGEFNEYTRYNQTAVHQMMAALRPKK